MNRVLSKTVLALGVLGSLVLAAVADDQAPSEAEAQFHRGFYLQVQARDLSGAAAAFDRVVADASAPMKLRGEAKLRLAQVREDQASANLAQLMPPDVFGYAEVVEPGEHVGRILQMMGLTGPALGHDGAADKPAQPPMPLGEGLFLPADFQISPALIAELKKFHAVAAGVTSLDNNGRPAGLIVIHPGDCNLVRGAIETAVQLLEPGEPIEGFKTYRVPEIGWVMLTARLVIVSDARQQLVAAVERLRNPQAASLASRADFKRAQTESKGALLFAYVDGQQIVKHFGPQLRGQEAAMIRGLLDLEHFESLVVALTTTEQGISLTAQMNLMPGHHNMIYALIRTAPISKRSLAQVPKGAAGVIVLGLNPPGPAAQQAGQPAGGVSAMDIGREFFHNIDEAALFALPPTGASTSGNALPEIGLVIAVKDAEKSEALWNQILSMAALFGARTAQPPAEVTIEGKPGRAYHFDGIPPLAVVRSPERGLIIGTQPAVAASLCASLNQESIAQDEAFAPLLARLTPDTSKAVLIDVGRAMQIVAAMSQGRSGQELREIGALVGDMKVSLVTDEAPNRLTIRADVTGLPKFRNLLPLLQGSPGRRPTAARR